MNSLILLIPFLMGVVFSHPTKYHVNRNETCYNPEPAKIYSWHIHLLYWQTNESHTKGAYEVRDKFLKRFENILNVKCKDLFHQEYSCVFEPEPQPDGPFLTANWAVFIMPEHFAETVSWIVQNRNGYDILIHPNTGCELEDHSWWAMWAGKPWEIDLSVMSWDQPFPWPEQQKLTTQQMLDSSETSHLVKTFLLENPDH